MSRRTTKQRRAANRRERDICEALWNKIAVRWLLRDAPLGSFSIDGVVLTPVGRGGGKRPPEGSR